jgi:hypothetical protein
MLIPEWDDLLKEKRSLTPERFSFADYKLQFLSAFCIMEFEIIFAPVSGEMPEWSIGAVSKTVVPFAVPRVRIPLSPPSPAVAIA